MKPCPKCQGFARVTDSRQTYDHTYRRKTCQKCAHTFSTYEIHSDEFDKVNKYNNLKKIISEHLQ